MNKIYMVISRLNPDEGGGINRAILNRTKALSEKGYDVNIVTFADFDTNKVKNKFYKMGRLDKRIKILNIYDYYRNQNTKRHNSKKSRNHYKECAKIFEQGYDVQLAKSKKYARYFKNGQYIKYKRWNKNGVLILIDYFNDYRKKIAREEYHENGYLEKKTFYNPINNRAMYTQYFTIDGFCFLNSWFGEDGQKFKKHFLFNRNSKEVGYFNSNKHFQTNWLNLICVKEKHKPFIICDGIGSAPKVMSMKENLAYRIYAIHSNHFTKPYRFGSKLKTNHKKVLDNLKEIDALVVLTTKQKQHIVEQFNDYGNIYVIPHNIENISKEAVQKENNTISIVSRLHPEKQIEHAIDAFVQVVQHIPNARLEIHGAGIHEDALTNRIKRLGLNENVFLRGYANRTDLLYQKSLVTLLTSKFEGFSFVVLESMANGTPVISYDVNYGPSDIITNGEDGYLIKPNKQLLADTIIDLLKDPQKAFRMGEVAKHNVYNRYHKQNTVNKWIDLFNNLKKNSVK